ncbi:DUF4411 family protein [Prevotella cerevisiae]|uniref:DUF4411 family protein n=1 Tax=Segatella cerevisiae TaxID=2053716 RepID=A0ABT1BZP5_9BACT|nr:DUF4411 family protein [Segatella cerevisiae]MCO6026557.1 DUF4411 family protein [Segatella cerevisiae]
MVALIDTCSLRRLVEYYLPFDKDKTLVNFLAHQYQKKELLVIDAVYEECKYQKKGEIPMHLPFLSSETSISTLKIPIDKKANDIIDNQFCVQSAYRKLSADESSRNQKYAVLKEKFMNTADFRLMLFAKQKNSLPHLFNQNIKVVTDETRNINDGKIFKKLPVCCELVDITSENIVAYLQENGVDINWIVSKQ